jgi:hypothetical protein
MVYVRRLHWDAWNLDHIARHDVRPDEVLEVCVGDIIASETYAGRLRLIGRTASGRMLTVILAPEGEGVYYAVTARPGAVRNGGYSGRGTFRMAANKKAIPQFKNLQEKAEFWDTHDTADFEEEFKPVRVRFGKNLTEGITVRLDSETLGELRALAHEKGMGPTTLARMWILEQLHRESGRKRRMG